MAAPAGLLGTLCAFALLAGNAWGQSQPMLRVHPPMLDLGVVTVDTVVEQSIELENLSTDPLRIVQIDRSCGCIQLLYEREDILPGERAKVTVRLEPRATSMRSVTVDFHVGGGGRFDRQPLTVVYFLRPALQFRPDQLHFGRCALGSTAEREVEILYDIPRGEKIFRPDLVLPEGVPLKIEVGEPEVTFPDAPVLRVRVAMSVRLETDRTAPYFRGELVFAGDEFVESRLPFSGMVYDRWYLEQDMIHLGILTVGKSRRREVLLRYQGDEVPGIRVLNSSSPEVSVSFQVRRDAPVLVLRIVATPAAAGDGEAEVTVQTDRGDQVESLRVRWQAREAPESP